MKRRGWYSPWSLLAAWSIVAPAQRLSPTAIPEHYDIHLAPDFATDTFGGHVSISVRLSEPARSITLHAAEIDFHEATITAGGTNQVARCHARRRQRNGDAHRGAADPRRRGRRSRSVTPGGSTTSCAASI